MANPNQNARRGDLVNRSPQSKAGALKQVVWSKIALFVAVSFFAIKANAWTIGEWADGGLIAPIELSEEFLHKFLKKAWEAVAHQERIWGYPIAVETVSLIYNKKLLDVPPPTALSELGAINEAVKKEHPGASAILWDYKSSYY